MGDLQVVLGSAGVVGDEVVRALTRLGAPVRAVQRQDRTPGPGIEVLQADLADPAGARRALEGAHTAYICVQPAYTRWPQEFPSLVTTIADAATAAGARLVLLDNLYGYGRVAAALTEQTPQAAGTRKGSVRAAIARDLLARHASGSLQVAVGRATDYFGARGRSVPNALALEPVARGRRGRWMGSLDRPHSLSYVPDIAAALTVLGTHDDAFGRAWHLPVSASPTGREFVGTVHRVAGVQATPGLVSPLMTRIAGLFVPDVREGVEMLYQFTEPFVADDSAFRAAFGSRTSAPMTTDLETAVEQSLAARRAALA